MTRQAEGARVSSVDHSLSKWHFALARGHLLFARAPPSTRPPGGAGRAAPAGSGLPPDRRDRSPLFPPATRSGVLRRTGARSAPHPHVAEAFFDLRDVFGPALSGLVYNAQLPDRHLTTLLEWADDLSAGDPSAAFDIEVLGEVFPALGVAWLSSFIYALADVRDAANRELRAGLEMTDLGDGVLVERTFSATAVIALALHGAQGTLLLRRTHRAVDENLAHISDMIARRG